MKKKTSDEVEICKKCKIKMKVISKSRRLLERDEMGDMTDAEVSDFEAAGMGGDSTDFEINQIMYECPKCHDMKTVEFM